LAKGISAPGVLVHISVLEESVHDAQCVVRAQLQLDYSVIIEVTITMPANHPFHTPALCFEVLDQLCPTRGPYVAQSKFLCGPV